MTGMTYNTAMMTRMPTVPFKSKLTLDSWSSWESRIETRFSIVGSQFLIIDSCKTHQTGRAFVYKQLQRVFVSSNLLSNLNTQLLRESTIFVQVLSNLLTSLMSKKISLLYKITNSTRLILARNSWTMQIIQ